MPNQDGSGPNGSGPQSGRALGRCGNNNANEKYGRGLGRGYGMGNGFRQNRFSGPNEKTWLENTISAVKEQLLALEKRKSDLED